MNNELLNMFREYLRPINIITILTLIIIILAIEWSISNNEIEKQREEKETQIFIDKNKGRTATIIDSITIYKVKINGELIYLQK